LRKPVRITGVKTTVTPKSRVDGCIKTEEVEVEQLDDGIADTLVLAGETLSNAL